MVETVGETYYCDLGWGGAFCNKFHTVSFQKFNLDGQFQKFNVEEWAQPLGDLNFQRTF